MPEEPEPGSGAAEVLMLPEGGQTGRTKEKKMLELAENYKMILLFEIKQHEVQSSTMYVMLVVSIS